MLASPGEVCHVEATNFSSDCGIPVEEDASDLARRLKISNPFALNNYVAKNNPVFMLIMNNNLKLVIPLYQ